MIALASASATCVRNKSRCASSIADCLEVQHRRNHREGGEVCPEADDSGPTNAFGTKRSPLLQILIEPCHGLFQPIDLMLGFDEHMAFAGIDDQLCRYAQRL